MCKWRQLKRAGYSKSLGLWTQENCVSWTCFYRFINETHQSEQLTRLIRVVFTIYMKKIIFINPTTVWRWNIGNYIVWGVSNVSQGLFRLSVKCTVQHLRWIVGIIGKYRKSKYWVWWNVYNKFRTYECAEKSNLRLKY